MIQYMRLYQQWKKYFYPKDKLDVPMQHHISGILECFNTVMRISQQIVAPTSTSRNAQYPIKHILWKDVPVNELRKVPFHVINKISLHYPMSVQTINKPTFVPGECTFIQQNSHHDQSLLQCLVMALQSRDQRNEHVRNFSKCQEELRKLLAGFAHSHMYLFRLSYYGNPDED